MALYFSAVVMKGIVEKLFKGEIITVELKVSLILNVSLCIRPLTL